MRRAAAAVAVAAMLCALTGCSGDKGPQGTPAQGTQKPAAPTAEEELAALLQRRARALEAGSVRRYAATATGRQRADDAREARNARELDLRDVTLKPIEVDVQGRRAVVRARSGYGIRGVRGRFEAERVLRDGEDGPRVAGPLGGQPPPAPPVGDRRLLRPPQPRTS